MSELSKLGVDTRRALLEEAERELATRRMSAYHLRMNPGYTLPKHLKIIGDDIDDLFAGNPPHNRAYFVSPRSGKSEIMCSAAASEMGRTGGKGSVLWISRSQELSNIMSRTVRGQILDPLYPFEKVSISKSSSSVEHWELEGRGMGAFNALGVLAGTVGIGASLTIYDDICGGIEDFCDPSGQPDPNKMRAYEEWYTTKARTRQAGRLSGSGPALSILISTRWSNFDPASMIITKGDWKVLRIPQFCDDVDNDPLGRTTLGECQWPEMFSQADMEQTRLDVGERVWSAHYQGLPQMESGSIFKKEWFGDEQLFDVVPTVDSYIPGERNTWTGTPGSRILVQRRADRVIACDGSWGLNKNSDWSVIATIAVVPDELRGCLFYVESVQRMRSTIRR